LLFGISSIQGAVVYPEVLPASELIKSLQTGGYIMYMRHGATDQTQRDNNQSDFTDCNNQRNLSAAGRDQVKLIGHAIRAHDIPIGDVLSSPYCRCKDTAQLAFGEFQINSDLQFSISKNEQEAEWLGKRLYTMMKNTDVRSTNVVFVGHTANLKDGLGIWPKPEGVTVVFQKKEDKLIYKGMIKPDEWSKH